MGFFFTAEPITSESLIAISRLNREVFAQELSKSFIDLFLRL